ncbi:MULTISPECIES: alpha/beta fold hydrolase [unclassified Crossiella]|uniref:alpha/beta fold hydrolase n=1 Tax=unclassified Crossiella TaxID=2620835 RepID=UPI002000589D|nr:MULTISPECIES: alpha/beta fold hydrolase [unclassified Crossiella]MCK2242650.1 alpha/beta hydrolase [Crossiella sp. S99.2]MCK2256527.1 alpha/beta hydrolase [Crossiella sp. S99.1]
MELSFDDQGAGEPVVLVHGHPFDRSMWRPQVEHLTASGLRVITPDLRGYGRSPVVPGVTGLDVFAADLAELLDRLGVERFVLGGLSMGGQIVLECYRQFPHRIRGLLLADTFAEAETAQGKADRNAQADRLLREGMAGYATEVLAKMVAPRTIEEQPEVAAHVLRMMQAAPPEGAAAALRGRAERPDYLPLLPTITVPTLVVVGSADEFTPVRDARTIQQGILDASLTIIDGAGHLPNLERPAEFNAALDRLLSVALARHPG